MPINQKVKELFLKCLCGCGQQLLINDYADNSIEINIRIDGRRKWNGVVLGKENIKELRKYIDKIAVTA
ncbi:hypothetical protein HY612_03015 [Candidatus Roizmanbacteria bacterium]|nr:hypothetical protein [Candidatus Roizmanbacteria bacterium]